MVAGGRAIQQMELRSGSGTAVARGRDYSDVSPLKGIYSGGESEELGVMVSLTRLPR